MPPFKYAMKLLNKKTGKMTISGDYSSDKEAVEKIVNRFNNDKKNRGFLAILTAKRYSWREA